jgi:adenosylmethionine-8-amino-7-oxononanoate aminotransferase
VSAAVALEVLRLYEEGGILANARRVAPRFEAGLAACLAHPLVGDARSRGLLGALELVADKATKRRFDPALRLPDRIADIAYGHRLVFRAFGDGIIGFAPALSFTEGEIDMLFERLARVLDDVLALEEVRAAMRASRTTPSTRAPATAASR